jgi:hypothetical protein
MTSLLKSISDELFALAVEFEDYGEVAAWEMKDCWGYWILPNGKILGSPHYHGTLVMLLSQAHPAVDESQGYYYLNRELRWIRARTMCPRRDLNTTIFDAFYPVTIQQRRAMREYVGLKDRDVILRIISDDSTNDVYLRGVKVGMYLR